MSQQPNLTVWSVVLGAPDPAELTDFYQRLLGWEDRFPREPDWTGLANPDGPPHLSFQAEADHVPPVWPAGADDQQQMQLHLDIRVEDLVAAAAWAVECGARLAEFQPQDDVRVFLDPAGHPFCLFTN
ncbi:MAG: VOC family protein [Actinomycetota bacterium]|nr:VOC family protein [Actinomycetota bacterium]